MTLGFLGVLLTAGVGLLAWVASLIVDGSAAWYRMEGDLTELRRDLQDLSEDVEDGTSDRIFKTEFRQWTELLEARNPDLDIPSVH